MNWRRIWRKRVWKIGKSRFPSKKPTRLLSKIAFFSFVGLFLAIIFAFITFAYYAKDLPRPDKVVRQEGFSTKIYDRNGESLYDVFTDQKRTLVTIDQVPLYLQQATIAIEDKNFYEHSGYDASGILRAAYNIVVKQKLQGGSTLTQQLVKNVLLTSERTMPRKIKEFILAVQIESRYSKEEILQMYLNEAPYGGTAYGVEAASEQYFDKKVTDLDLLECALLAGLPQRPPLHSPFAENSDWQWRTKEVLRRMKEDGYINAELEEEAVGKIEELEFVSPATAFKAPHFVMYVKKLLEEKYGEEVVEQGGLKVYTTLDYALQEEAQKIVSEEIAKVESVHITNGAALVTDPGNGEILAMVGSKNYDDPDYDGQVNVTLSLRQPGSAIKPVTYLTALKKNYTAATVMMDTGTSFPGGAGQPDYSPVNYDGKFHGPMQLRYALGNSINMPAVKLLARVGIKEMLQTAYEMGLVSLEPTTENMKRLGLSVTLGGGEVRLLDLVSAYSAFANGGLKTEPVAILKVTDRNDKVIFEHKTGSRAKVMSEEQAFIISHILADNSARAITFGANNSLNISGRTVAAKTGTTNDKRDNWTIGWTPQVVVGVWVGNNDNTPMKQLASGVSGAAPIWRKIILRALSDKPNMAFKVPGGVVTAEVDSVSGYRAHGGYPSRMEYFVKGSEPSGEDPIHQNLKLCRGQNKLATPAMVARGDYEEKEFFVFKEDDPFSTDGINRWQAGIDLWAASQGDERYRPPSDYCGSATDMEVAISSPGNQVQIDNNEVTVSGKVISEAEVSRIEIFINGQSRETIENSRKFDKVFTLDEGTYTIKVKAKNNKGEERESEVKIGVKKPWDWQVPTPTPTPTPTVLPTATPTLAATPTEV